MFEFVNPLWEWVIGPTALVTLGYCARPPLERWMDREEEKDRVWRDSGFRNTSHVKVVQPPFNYDSN